jgi:circadian clock protein KaiC
LIVGFYESTSSLIAKAASINIDLARFFENGQLEMLWNPPLEILVDALAHKLLENLDRRAVARLFIDGMDGLLDIIMHRGRSRAFLTALVNELRCRQVTTFITRELPYFSGMHPGKAGPTSVLYENIILLQYVTIAESNHRQIGVLKLRQNGYDAANHIMLISGQGVTIDRPVLEEKLAQRANESKVEAQ